MADVKFCCDDSTVTVHRRRPQHPNNNGRLQFCGIIPVCVVVLVLIAATCWQIETLKSDNLDLRRHVALFERRVDELCRGRFDELKIRDLAQSFTHSSILRQHSVRRRFKRSGERGHKNTYAEHFHVKARHFQINLTSSHLSRHADEIQFPEFRRSNWIDKLSSPSSVDFKWRNGEHTAEIKETGLYLIYAQGMFFNAATNNQITVSINGETFVRCADGVDYIDGTRNAAENSKQKSCFTSGVAFLEAGQRIEVRSEYAANHISTIAGGNFWGFVKLSDQHD